MSSFHLPIPDSPNDDPRIVAEPVFLVGAERSGTTLLLLMLGHHPELAFPGEFDFTVRCMPGGSAPALADYYEFLERNRIFRYHDLEIDRDLDFEQLVNSFLIQERERAGKPRVGASVHGCYGNLIRVWPGAKLIHIVRDPRDVASSNVALGWSGNVWAGVRKWIESETEWSAAAAAVPAAQQLELRYEDLLGDVEGTLRELCSFIGLEYSDEMLRYHEDSSYAPVDPAISQKWRKHLSARAIRRLESRAGRLLSDRGYEPSGHPPLELGGLETSWLQLHDAYHRRARRIRKYGWRLSLLRPLAKLLRSERWLDELELEFQASDNRNMK